MPTFSQELLDQALDQSRAYTSRGAVADYIPELGKQDPDLLGVAVYQAGDCLSSGDAEVPFTIQSIVKVALYSLALDLYSLEELQRHVGLKPTSKPFNSVIELELSVNNVPVNPFINAGAIVVTSLLYDAYGEATGDKIQERISRLIGRSADYSEEVRHSESTTAFGNRTLTYLMLSEKILPHDLPVEKVLDLYFTSCSYLVTCRDLAHFSYVLSNQGKNVQGEAILTPDQARILRTLMASCGTYDYSGDFAVLVGLPAKSGVGGGIMTASQDPYGLAVFGPALDQHGNSYAGVRILSYLSQALGLNIY